MTTNNNAHVEQDEDNTVDNTALLDRIGQLTRTLHESMRELGLDKEVEKAAEEIPDARDRLSYIAQMTHDAAERSLSAIEVAKPLEAEITERAQALEARWNRWFESPVELDQARDLVSETRAYLADVPERAQAVDTELHNIMMAQDFQDLTGQVVGKLVEVIHHIEQQLVETLLDNVPEDRGGRSAVAGEGKSPVSESLKNGPQIRPDQNADVVSDQAQVDDLLDSLGF